MTITVTREELTKKAIQALYEGLGIRDAIKFLQMVGIARGDFTEEHRVMPEFSDQTTEEIIRDLLIRREEELALARVLAKRVFGPFTIPKEKLEPIRLEFHDIRVFEIDPKNTTAVLTHFEPRLYKSVPKKGTKEIVLA